LNVVSILNARLGVSQNTIRRIFKRCHDGEPSPETVQAGRGRHRKLPRNNPGLIAGVAALNNLVPPVMASFICNAVNEKKFPGDETKQVCRNTLIDTLKSYTDCDISTMLRRKTGSKNPDSDWAEARVVISRQMLDQLALGKLTRMKSRMHAEAIRDNEFPPLWRDGCLFADENHVRRAIRGAGHAGAGSHYQYRVSVHEKTGEPLPCSDGGVLPEKKARLVPKYTKEARGCYGVACPTSTVDGETKPQFMETFDYTQKTLRSKKMFDAILKTEKNYRRGSTYKGWSPFKGKNPYKERYGDKEWEAKLLDAPKVRPNKSIEHLMDHIISEGTRIFSGTKRADTWMIYHDHLKIWWEKQSQNYLKSLPCPIEG
jgi:hypothetical protein